MLGLLISVVIAAVGIIHAAVFVAFQGVADILGGVVGLQQLFIQAGGGRVADQVDAGQRRVYQDIAGFGAKRVSLPEPATTFLAPTIRSAPLPP